MDFLEKLNEIENQIQKYYEMSFENDEEDYNYNRSLKIKIEHLIIDSKKGHSNIIDAALLVLAKSTGCAEDQEIAENIINRLHDQKFISDVELNYFYDNISTGRWV